MNPRHPSLLPRPARLTLLPALLLTILLLPGCTVGPDDPGPPAAFAADRYLADAPDPEADASDQTVGPEALTRWWQQYRSPALTTLVERALAQNLDLEAAAARVRRSRALLRAAGAELLPRVAGSADATRSRRSETLDGLAPAAGVGVGSPGFDLGPATTDFFAVGVDASWELDFFGGRRRYLQQQTANFRQTQAQAVATRLGVVAEVADAYFSRLYAARLLEIAEANVDSLTDSAALTRQRFDAGLVGELDAAQADAQLDEARAEIPAAAAQVALQAHRLAVLLGQAPADLEALLTLTADAQTQPVLPRIAAVGLPSDLLRRRPDVIAAEQRLAAAWAGVGVQTAEYFPKINLLASVGFQSGRVDQWFDSDSRVWSLGGVIDWRLLDFGRIDAAVDAAEAQTAEAAADYKAAVIGAVREVDDALTRLAASSRQVQARQRSLESRNHSLELAQRQYDAGLQEFLPVLDEQRRRNRARTALAVSQRDRLLATVRVFRVLGGGWDPPAP